jgi:hypothetical protein
VQVGAVTTRVVHTEAVYGNVSAAVVGDVDGYAAGIEVSQLRVMISVTIKYRATFTSFLSYMLWFATSMLRTRVTSLSLRLLPAMRSCTRALSM